MLSTVMYLCHLGTSLKSHHGRVHAFTTIHIQPFPLPHYYGIGMFKLWLASVTRKKSSTSHLSLMCSADRCIDHHKHPFVSAPLSYMLHGSEFQWWIHRITLLISMWYWVSNVIVITYWLIPWTAINKLLHHLLHVAPTKRSTYFLHKNKMFPT
jgi:hypothetical protein